MPYCPQCHTEYRPDAKECIDCRVPLVEGTPQFCPRCNEFVTEDDTFCDHCGILQPEIPADETPECENHPDVDAVGGCVVCGKPVCRDCAREQHERIFCEDDDHLNLHQGFVVAYTTSTDYEAQMIKANLEGAGIDTVIFNQHDHVYFTNMGMLALVKIIVKRSQLEDALEIIDVLLADDEVTGDGDGSDGDTA